MTTEQLNEVIQPESALEQFLLRQPEILEGMAWGKPRFGHPEGAVWKHVVEVLANVNRLDKLSVAERRDLRLVTILHDTFKYAEDKSEPRDWSKHHGILARSFAAPYVKSSRVLELVQWHDELYYCWRLHALHNRPSLSRQRMDTLLDRFRNDLEFYFRFFTCDTRTGDKNLAPLLWAKQEWPIPVLTF